MSDIAIKIGDDLQSFGGHLECNECKRQAPLGDTGSKLANGWPMCCGYTMTWITQRQIEGVS